ncbi:MAG: hypothetical protein JO267_09700 [Alphaproteobacteria bacterium]|nr:hypothetical protein [Alphaproteobacteria bacterium]
MSGVGRAIGLGVIMLIEAFVIWRVGRALNRGMIKIDPLFWLTDIFGGEFTAARARHPFWYWFGIVSTVMVGQILVVLLAKLVFGPVH